MDNSIVRQFDNYQIRSIWDVEQEQWYFSVVDVVGALTEQDSARSASTYWAVLKKRLVEEGANQLLTNCKQLKMPAKANRESRMIIAQVIAGVLQDVDASVAMPNLVT